MACFKQHGEHFAPQVVGLNGAAGFDFAGSSFLLISHIGFFERNAKFVVQVGAVRWGEQGPSAVFHDAAHEQVGNPVGGVHVVRAAAVVAGVFAQF